jgi:protein-L-isoaspartate(D-aspartate) O-methyltransferase
MANIVPDLLIKSLLDALRRKGVLSAPGVEAAFRALPRHHFLPDVPLDKVYTDEAIPLKHDPNGQLISSSSQPTMMAIMLEQAQLAPGLNVLEIGTATGYNAALIQHLVGENGSVTTVELDAELAKQAVNHLLATHMSNVRVVQGDGAQGYAPRAAYDRIIATAGVWDVPPAWLTQLKRDGKVIVPIWLDGVQVSAVFSPQSDGTFYSDDNRPCAFVYMRGDFAGPEMRRRVGSSALYILGDDLGRLDTSALHLLLSDDHSPCHLESSLDPHDYWNGFQLYLMLHEPKDFIFALFAIPDGQKAYGIDGRGVALFTPGSAAFTTYHEKGLTHCFAGSEAFLALQQKLDEWNAANRPETGALRLRLIPKQHGEPPITEGKLYKRRDHYLHVWQAPLKA